jgi:hypothetical protein
MGPGKEVLLRICIALKNTSHSAGFEPANFGPVAIMITIAPPRTTKNRLNHSLLYFDRWVYLNSTVEDNSIMNVMIGSIYRIQCAVNLFVNINLISYGRSQMFELLYLESCIYKQL